MTGNRLPLTVIGGFLGAGKTTLLNHWLRHANGRRLALLVNDFGALNIDAMLIESSAGDTIALSNGCVCCQIGDDLSAALIRVLDATTPFDAVVIEASGVSDPWRIAQMGRADPGLSLDGVIVLVDASAALAQSRDPLLADTLERQLKAADLIVINKCELAGADERVALRRWIDLVAGPVAQYETTQAIVPLAMLSGLAMPSLRECSATNHHDHDHAATNEPASEHRHEHDNPTHDALFDTWSCRPARIFDAESLRAWLRDVPAGVLRLKGVLRAGTADSDWCEIQFAGRHGSLRSTVRPDDGAAALVAIGLRGQVPVAMLGARFAGPS